MNSQTYIRTIVAGIIGTTAMTALALMGPLMGMPEMKTGEMLAAFMGIPPTIGWIAHFMIGSILAVLYGVVFSKIIPGTSLLKGAVYGVMPWLVLQVMLSPMMGSGFFSLRTPSPTLFLLGSLMGHIMYGAVVGAVYGDRPGLTRAPATSR